MVQHPIEPLPPGQSHHQSKISVDVNLIVGLYVILFLCADRVGARIPGGPKVLRHLLFCMDLSSGT